MKQNKFSCHMCEQVMDGAPNMRVGMIGFNWQPILNSEPAQMLDLCEFCAHALLAAYATARNRRLAETYEKQRHAWLQSKLSELDKAKTRATTNRQRHAVRAVKVEHDVYTTANRNYRRGADDQQVWKF